MFIGFDKIFGDLYLALLFCVFIILMLILIWISLVPLCIYFYHMCMNPIKKYIQERNERLMIKIYSDLKLRSNSKTQYLKLV